MKKVLFLFFILLMAGTALAENLTDATEQTEAPVVNAINQDDSYIIVIEETEPDCEIYYMIGVFNFDTHEFVFGDVQPYTGTLVFTQPGQYLIEAYAIAPGKLQSSSVFVEFIVVDNSPQPWLIPDPPYIDVEQLEDGSCKVTITPEDIGGQLFYHVNVHYGDGQLEPYGDFESLDDFKPYPDTLHFIEPGHYYISAYTKRPGETQSHIAYDSCTVTAPAPPEYTRAPSFMSEMIEVDGRYVAYRVSIIPEEPCEIYYRTLARINEDYWDWAELSQWAIYTDPVEFWADGYYRIEAYAIAGDKEPSDHIAYECRVEIPVEDYDFEEDGIFYKIIGDGMVSVSHEMTGYENNYSGDVVIPDFVTHDGVTYQVCAICEDAFSGSSVTSVTIGDCVTTIGEGAFRNCYDLTEVVLGDYVIEVGSDAFICCYNMSKLTIGSGVARIGSEAFAYCPLTDIICKPATPPVMADSDCFNCYDTATLHVHPAVADSYRMTDYWNRFANIVAEKHVNPAPGDVNGDGQLNISDITSLISNLMSSTRK